jgi:hypothetical protein
MDIIPEVRLDCVRLGYVRFSDAHAYKFVDNDIILLPYKSEHSSHWHCVLYEILNGGDCELACIA